MNNFFQTIKDILNHKEYAERIHEEMWDEWSRSNSNWNGQPEDPTLAARLAARDERQRDDAFRKENNLPLDGWERQTYDVASSQRELKRRIEIEESWKEEDKRMDAFDEEVRRQQIDDEYERIQNRADILAGIVGPREPEKTRWDYLEL